MADFEKLLGTLIVDASAGLESPSGGSVRLNTDKNNLLVVQIDRAKTVWELFRLIRSVGIFSSGYRSIRRQKNPLAQPLRILVGEREFLRWPPGKPPRVVSARVLLRVLRAMRR